ncbi:MAG TPA: HNH endonuclease, partial [Kofleriaceae bacterium]|nr:HNH endonuclease [Kofleriaceae bacterium]
MLEVIMLQQGVEGMTAGAQRAPAWGLEHARETVPHWRTVDRALRAIRRRRDALDAEEAGWLRQAEALEIWRPLGMVSALDYLERVLGYAPRTAQERLRVARALGDLPRLTASLAGGALSYSAIRELSRVATPATEAAWIAAAAGKSLRQVEELVADHRPGDRPDDPPDPQARRHVVRFELSADTFALLRQVRSVLDDEHGQSLADDGFIAALCAAALDRPASLEPSGRARFQIAVTVCERCRRGWQQGAGVQVPIDPAAVERAMCDAQHVGSIDGEGPERAHQDIPPSVARFVWRRDAGRCRVPGCRSSRGLELHHIVHRTEGGGHEAPNLVLVCSACHRSHHAGILTIAGTAAELVVRRPWDPASGHDTREAAGRERPVSEGNRVRAGERSGSAHVDARGG